MKRTSHGSRYAAPDWGKILKAGTLPSQVRSTAASPTEDGDYEASRPISRASSSYFIAPSKLGSRQGSTSSLHRLVDQPSWQTADIEEFLKRRSTDASNSQAPSRRVSNFSDFVGWVNASKAKTSYQLPMFVLPSADSKALQPKPSSMYQRSADSSSTGDALAQSKALQHAACKLLADQQEAATAEGAGDEDLMEQQAAAPAALQTQPKPVPAAQAAASAAWPGSLVAGHCLSPGPFSTPGPAGPAAAGLVLGSRAVGSARRASPGALPSKPAGTPAYGCITTSSSAVVARQPASSSAARSSRRAAATPAALEQAADSVADHLQQLKLLQQQAHRLFA